MKIKKLIAFATVISVIGSFALVAKADISKTENVAYGQTFDTAEMWNNDSDLWINNKGMTIEDGKLKITAGSLVSLSLPDLGLKADGSTYVISFNISAKEWVSTSSYTRAEVYFSGTSNKSVFAELTYGTSTKAECSLLGQHKGANGTLSHNVKLEYTPSTGAINATIGSWASQTATYDSGNVASKFNIYSYSDTIYIDDLYIYKKMWQ